MRNLEYFDTFIKSINEGIQNWDPKKAQKAIEDLKNKSSEMKDSDPTGLSFNNIQKVYGKTDYRTRFKIALDPISGIFITKYIGEKDQNLTMDKLAEPLLRAIKPIVDDLDNDIDGYFDQKISSTKSLIKKAKVEVDKISK